MQINCIDDIHELDNLKMDWDAVYAADPRLHLIIG